MDNYGFSKTLNMSRNPCKWFLGYLVNVIISGYVKADAVVNIEYDYKITQIE